jgi:DNA polymerase-3 subunit epsilon
MKLKLEKDIIFFDIESTGLSTSKDRIVQLAIIKCFADGRPNLERTRLINPTIPIPEESSKIHKITDDVVKDEPTFLKLSKGLFELIGDADLAGFNSNRFDIVMLMEEFERCGMQLDMTERRCVDVLRIFHQMESRTLRGAMRFYCNEKMENAHDAMVDTKATLKVLEAQLEKYSKKGYQHEDKEGNMLESPIKNNIQVLHDFTNDPNELDFQGKIKRNEEGVPCFTFGKYQSKPIGSSMAGDSKYHAWIMAGDFASDTKRVITQLMNEFIVQNNNVPR